jgi:hypothetical protein
LAWDGGKGIVMAGANTNPNPGELLIFGNPKGKRGRRHNSAHREVLKSGTREVVIWKDAEGSKYHVSPYTNSGETILKSLGKFAKLETARAKANAWLERGRNPEHRITAAEMLGTRKMEELKHAEAEHAKARKIYDSAKQGSPRWREAAADLEFWGNKTAYLSRLVRGNGKLGLQRVARERAERIRGARLNPKAQLTPEEKHAWERAFSFHLDAGNSDAVADRLAWRDLKKEFPRLNKFSGAKSNPRQLTVPEKHQLKIARDTLRMPDAMAGVTKGVKVRGDESLKELRALRARNRRNPDELQQAVQLYQSFHGRDPKGIVDAHVSAAVRLEYTTLGDLEYLKVLTPLEQKAQFNFDGDRVKLASSPDGKTLYVIGGNQDLRNCLDKDSLEKDFIDLGEAQEVQYLARKVHGQFRPVSYYHKFGEKNGAKPRLMFDKLKKQIFFVGGEYLIDTSKGVSPGIEN